MKDYDQIGNCNDTYCKYFDESMELNCSYSEDNSKCIRKQKADGDYAVLCAVPIIAGDSYGVQFLCSACDFPKNDTLTMDMKYCWNCGIKLDWSELDE